MSDMDDERRPSPEAMLKLAQAEEAEAKRGKLKIFLGYAAGVGKTYAMLQAARERRHEGRDVVAAYVESHGRPETDALLEGLEILPAARIEYQGVMLPELDIDGVLARRPQLALVDELAHTNAPGSRHEKRWQDVEELLAAGIDVFTTVNVQHFESLNDVVAQITGIAVRETVPDRLLDLAAEIRLVDIPPEDLLQRLREGKVYVPEQAAFAAEKFFRAGNLIALRELSLRRAAVRVDEEMRAYMEARAIPGPWPAAERLLVSISGSPFSERLIRTTRRLADELKAPWFTVYVETPGNGRHEQENRKRVWKDLRLAESLGAQVATVTATSVAEALIDYARRHNVTRIVVGKPAKPRWREFLRLPLVDRIIRLSGAIDVHVVSYEPAEAGKGPVLPVRRGPISLSGYLASLALVVAASLACLLLRPFLAPTNMVMIYLLAVVLAALRLGLKPAILTAFLGVLAFDFFFIPPHLTFAVADTQYLITFVALFTVGVVISTLVSTVRERAEAVREREEQTASLYYLSRDLAAAADIETLVAAVIRNIGETLFARAAVLLPEGDRLRVAAASKGLKPDVKEMAVADWAFRNRQTAGQGTETLASAGFLYLPLQTSGSVLGVLGIRLKNDADYRSTQVRRMLDAFTSQTAMALERVQLSRQAEQAQILQARENLERALLNSISHDLRTPLVAITGALDTLRDKVHTLADESRLELLDTAWEEAERLNRFVGNLLDMTRLESGAIKLKRELSDVQDLIGCALAALERRIGERGIDVRLAPDLPLVRIDMVLMTQVLVNLLDNALKYSPPDSGVEITARVDGGRLRIEMADRGPGIPEQDLKRVFDKFYRIAVPEGAQGTGLGLSICKGIVEAHGGSIRAENRTGGGLRVIVTLPLAGGAKEGVSHGP
ncbi:sensor histidine kinase [Geobacter sulfurreducens]|uniref:sensor histidine kinase n=1 Tax=Geobacter sulfurreducens TaxID=35554 RepID=UPI0001E34280|nr:sensor histidine kinase KdpD [Geobacter sulfurreducens]ADI85238.2 osmosensitive potassium channel sensor histidine kinase KdpD, KdpD and USP_OKCHK domain-containing [Geobacter sulfurreducens KN400]AJY68721.1 ornithine acetyltransferase [Geobacter sulfurreducens]